MHRGSPLGPVVGVLLLTAAAACAVLTVALLLLPSSVDVDTDYAEDVFFGCGTALTPTVEPREEPGIRRRARSHTAS